MQDAETGAAVGRVVAGNTHIRAKEEKQPHSLPQELERDQCKPRGSRRKTSSDQERGPERRGKSGGVRAGVLRETSKAGKPQLAGKERAPRRIRDGAGDFTAETRETKARRGRYEQVPASKRVPEEMHRL